MSTTGTLKTQAVIAVQQKWTNIRVVAICQLKGGWKSTAARHGSLSLKNTALLDLDPPGLVGREARRQQNGRSTPTAIFVDRLTQAKMRLQKQQLQANMY